MHVSQKTWSSYEDNALIVQCDTALTKARSSSWPLGARHVSPYILQSEWRSPGKVHFERLFPQVSIHDDCIESLDIFF